MAVAADAPVNSSSPARTPRRGPGLSDVRGCGCLGDAQADPSGSLEIDNQLEPRRLFHRQIGRFRTLEDFDAEDRRAAIGGGIAPAVCDKPASIDELSRAVDRWQPNARSLGLR